MKISERIAFSLKSNRRLISDLAFAAICLAIASFFPGKTAVQDMTKTLIALVLLPILYVRLIAKERLAEWGMGLGREKTGLAWGMINLMAILAIFLLLGKFSGFSKNYQLANFASISLWLFMAYELVFVNFSLFVMEFFWRGFVLNALRPKFGSQAALIEAAICILALVPSGGSWWQKVPFLIFAFTGSLTAYRSRSFLYSYASQLLAMIALGAFLIRLQR